MNLENLNLVELNAQEKRETDGGISPVYFCFPWYKAGKAVLGFWAGVGDGIRAGME